jgi:hypothetical protein
VFFSGKKTPDYNLSQKNFRLFKTTPRWLSRFRNSAAVDTNSFWHR